MQDPIRDHLRRDGSTTSLWNLYCGAKKKGASADFGFDYVYEKKRGGSNKQKRRSHKDKVKSLCK